MTDSTVHPTAAALIAIAEGITAGIIKPPTSIDFWSHNLSATELLSVADAIDSRITIHQPSKASPGHASARAYFPTADGSARITVYSISSDISPVAVSDYTTHNTECAVA